MHDLQFYLDEFAKDDLIYLFLPIFLLGLAVEVVIDRRKNLQLFEKKDTIASLWMTFFVVFVDVLPKLCALVLFYYLHSISPLADIVQRQWWAWVLLFFLDDFAYYCMHRGNHEVRLFWAGHVSHHSAIKMNFATALRQGVMERLHKYAFWLPLPLLGFDPLMIFTMISHSPPHQGACFGIWWNLMRLRYMWVLTRSDPGLQTPLMTSSCSSKS